jgi:hypothetical protein
MGVVRMFDADDYRPEYSLLVLKDPTVAWPDEHPHMPHYRDRGDTPNGTFAGSGAGWIYADAPDLDDHLIRVELHDEPPLGDHVRFDEVLDTPYRSSSGAVSLAWVTCGPGGRIDLELGDDEWFRVRIARRREDADGRAQGRYHWLLRFWPDLQMAPPVWLTRSEPVRDSRLAQDIEAILRWTSSLPLKTATADLAKQLLVSEENLREALTIAEQTGLLHADGEEPLQIWLGRRAGS